MQPARPHPYLCSEPGEATAEADAVIVGLAADGGVSFRPGAVEGPAGIRAFSDSIESYSPRAQRDLTDMRLVDVGDHDDRTSVEEMVGDILDRAWVSDTRPLFVSFGGDHSVTPPAVRAVAKRSTNLAVIGFDAHLDLREDYPGDHACTYRRISDAGIPCVVLGPRSGDRKEWEDVPTVLDHLSTSLEIPSSVFSTLEDRDIYVTIDIDVLDPSVAPGTGNPEPGGPGFTELLEAIEGLSDLRVVAFDIVEVSPPLDPSGITQAAAAVLARELILRFA